jgi:hypothetical protein
MPDVVRVNQTLYSWNSTDHAIDNFPYEGIVGVNYEQTRKRKVVYAARKQGTPLGYTAGKYEVPSFTLKALKDTAEAITDYLTEIGEGSYGDAVFQYLLGVSEPDAADAPIKVSMEYCVVQGKKDVYDEGIDELVTEFDLATLLIVENSKQLWSAVRSLGSP